MKTIRIKSEYIFKKSWMQSSLFVKIKKMEKIKKDCTRTWELKFKQRILVILIILSERVVTLEQP